MGITDDRSPTTWPPEPLEASGSAGGDASLLPRGDASPPAPFDASRRTCATDHELDDLAVELARRERAPAGTVLLREGTFVPEPADWRAALLATSVGANLGQLVVIVALVWAVLR